MMRLTVQDEQGDIVIEFQDYLLHIGIAKPIDSEGLVCFAHPVEIQGRVTPLSEGEARRLGGTKAKIRIEDGDGKHSWLTAPPNHECAVAPDGPRILLVQYLHDTEKGVFFTLRMLTCMRRMEVCPHCNRPF